MPAPRGRSQVIQRRIDIDREMAAAVASAGGCVVADLLPKSPGFHNADYLFQHDGIVAELKRLDKDVVGDKEFNAKLAKVYSKLMRERRAPRVVGRASVSAADIAAIDERAAHEFIEPFKQRLAKVVKKANSQIRDTAKYFGLANPQSLLLLANDGDRGFQLDTVLYALSRILRGRHSSISAVIYFTANLPANVPGIHPHSQVWVPLLVPDRAVMAEAFLGRIADAWFNRIATVTGQPIPAFTVDGSRVDPAHVRFDPGPSPKLNLDNPHGQH